MAVKRRTKTRATGVYRSCSGRYEIAYYDLDKRLRFKVIEEGYRHAIAAREYAQRSIKDGKEPFDFRKPLKRYLYSNGREREAARRDLAPAQDWKCAICRQSGPLGVDHDHSSGLVRGLLCNRCNSGLGMFGDTAMGVRRALNYLEQRRYVNGDAEDVNQLSTSEAAELRYLRAVSNAR